MLAIIRFPKFFAHVCGLRGNKVFEILVSGNLALRTDFRTVRKVRRGLQEEISSYISSLLKSVQSLLGDFIGFDMYIINLISVLIFSLFFYPY